MPRHVCSEGEVSAEPRSFEPPLKFADPQPEGADFLGDGLEVFQAEEMIRRGLAVVKSATALGPPTRQCAAQKRAVP